MTKKTGYILALSLVAILVLFIKNIDSPESKTPTPEYKIETFITSDGGWGYSIYANENRIITQDVIPAIQKKMAFQTKKDAEKTGKLVISKLKKNQLPTLKKEELELLKIAI